MNELDLIREVEKRPILYDKSVTGFNRTKLRDDAWKEVQEVLDVSESECKKRWRSLRDSFIKLQRTHGSRTRWPYLQAMKFLLPHVEPSTRVYHEETSRQQPSDSEEEERQKSLPDISFAVDPNRINQLSDDDDISRSPEPKKAKGDEESTCQCNRSDPDELFLLSCAPTLQRLNSKQNASVKLKIQQVLYEAEFGNELPYITPASDSSYENADGSA